MFMRRAVSLVVWRVVSVRYLETVQMLMRRAVSLVVRRVGSVR